MRKSESGSRHPPPEAAAAELSRPSTASERRSRRFPIGSGFSLDRPLPPSRNAPDVTQNCPKDNPSGSELPPSSSEALLTGTPPFSESFAKGPREAAVQN
ncbi:Hypothetical predicted protein [Podarcis lilfordi]|uniref:Uncharacterized protein n=1 Tax=Podarcis lilfordi TaxID=74358 RepID=A0AA35PM10_9SAUR|nr:Hypothetical predicted protein [Podarcis lilfordi]